MNAVINAAGAERVNYGTKITIKATASNLDPAYHLVLIVESKEYQGSNTEVSSEEFELKNDLNYTVKIVDAAGNIPKDSNGNGLKKTAARLPVMPDFFKN